jgi:hypothetical protein
LPDIGHSATLRRVDVDLSFALDLAVRENATWCDLVCRLSRLTPSADASMWWTTRRAPERFPDAVTLTPTASVYDALSRIDNSAGASVKDSFATLDLEPDGYSALFDATWIARPPAGVSGPPPLMKIADKFRFGAWRHAAGVTEDSLPNGILRAAGVTVVGAHTPDGFTGGGILHHTRIGGAEVVGLSNAFGSFAAVADTALAMFPGSWIVGYERGDELPQAVAQGFLETGPLRVWMRSG